MKRKVIRYTIQGWDSCYKIRSRYWPRRFDPRCWIDGEEQVGDGYDYAEFETLSDAQAALRKCYPFATFSAERGNIIMSRHYIEEWACTLDEDGDIEDWEGGDSNYSSALPPKMSVGNADYTLSSDGAYWLDDDDDDDDDEDEEDDDE